MPLIYVDTLEDPRLDAFARLTEAQLRSKLEPERALFIAESQKVIERAFEGGMEPISLLMEEKWLPSMAPLIERMEARRQARARELETTQTGAQGAAPAPTGEPETPLAQLPSGPDSLPVFVAPHDELARLTGFELTRGALGAFRRSALPHRGRRAARRASGGRPRRYHEPHERGGHLPQRGGPRSRRRARQPRLLRPAVPPGRARVHGRRLPGAVDAHRRRRTCRTAPAAAPGAMQGIAELHEHGFTCAAMALSDDSVTPDELNARWPSARPPAGALGEAGAAVRHRGRGALPRHHRAVRLHRAHPHGPRRRLPERGRLQRRGLLRLPAV